MRFNGTSTTSYSGPPGGDSDPGPVNQWLNPGYTNDGVSPDLTYLALNSGNDFYVRRTKANGVGVWRLEGHSSLWTFDTGDQYPYVGHVDIVGDIIMDVDFAVDVKFELLGNDIFQATLFVNGVASAPLIAVPDYVYDRPDGYWTFDENYTLRDDLDVFQCGLFGVGWADTTSHGKVGTSQGAGDIFDGAIASPADLLPPLGETAPPWDYKEPDYSSYDTPDGSSTGYAALANGSLRTNNGWTMHPYVHYYFLPPQTS